MKYETCYLHRLFVSFFCLMLFAGTAAGEDGVLKRKNGRQASAKTLDLKKVEAAIKSGLDFLEARQMPEGFWQNDARVMRRETTAWALLAFFANGHTPQAGPYRQTVEKGLSPLYQAES